MKLYRTGRHRAHKVNTANIINVISLIVDKAPPGQLADESSEYYHWHALRQGFVI